MKDRPREADGPDIVRLASPSSQRGHFPGEADFPSTSWRRCRSAHRPPGPARRIPGADAGVTSTTSTHASNAARDTGPVYVRAPSLSRNRRGSDTTTYYYFTQFLSRRAEPSRTSIYSRSPLTASMDSTSRSARWIRLPRRSTFSRPKRQRARRGLFVLGVSFVTRERERSLHAGPSVHGLRCTRPAVPREDPRTDAFDGGHVKEHVRSRSIRDESKTLISQTLDRTF